MTLFFTLVVMSILMCLGLAARRWLFSDSAEEYDPDRELYRQLLNSAQARARSYGKRDLEWELYQQRYD